MSTRVSNGHNGMLVEFFCVHFVSNKLYTITPLTHISLVVLLLISIRLYSFLISFHVSVKLNWLFIVLSLSDKNNVVVVIRSTGSIYLL